MVGLQSILTLYGSGGINVNQSTTAVSIVAKITNAAPKKILEIRVIRDLELLPARKDQNVVMLSVVCKLVLELSFTGKSSSFQN